MTNCAFFISKVLITILNFFLCYLSNVHVVTICTKTISLVSDKKLTNCLNFGKGKVKTEKESIEKIKFETYCFQRLFLIIKKHKLFMTYALLKATETHRT